MSRRKLIALIGRHLAIAGPSLILVACKAGFLPGSKEVLVEAVPTSAELSVLPQPDNSPAIEPLKPLQLSFNDSAYHVTDSSSWLYRGYFMTFVPDQGHLQLGSVMIHSRSQPWDGPLLRLPALEPGKAYRASVWIKLIETNKPSEAELVLSRLANGIMSSFVLGKITASPGVWQKLDGEFLATPQWRDDIHTLTIAVANIDTKYLVDDFVVAHAEFSAQLEAAAFAQVSGQGNFFQNGDVEQGMENWSHQGGVISRSSVQAHSGSYSLLISGRSLEWHAPAMEVKRLQDNRRYKFSIFARLNDGEPPANVRLTLKRVTSGQIAYIHLGSAKATSSDWVEVSGIFTAPNISASELVTVYLESDNPAASYYVDTLTAQEIAKD